MSRCFEKSNNDYIEVGNIPALDLTGDEVTLSAWIRLESTDAEGKILAKWADAGDRFQYLLSTNSGDKCMFAVFNGGTKIAQGTSTLVVGQWYHLAGTYDGSNIRIYCHGTLEDTTPVTGNLSSTVDIQGRT